MAIADCEGGEAPQRTQRTSTRGRLRHAKQKATPWRSLIVPSGEVLSLEHTLLSGQTFRWRKEDNDFVGVVSGKVLRLTQRGRRLSYSSRGGRMTSDEIRHYLGFGDCHAEAIRAFRADRILGTVVRDFGGMRILRQDPWETLISFIISANNNIVRIRRCVESLCRRFGKEIHGAPGCYAFPSPAALAEASPDRLQQLCNLGYRAAYVRKTSREIVRNPDLLSQIARLPYPETKKEVMNLPGVGPKVADCVLLYSLGKHEAFPVDTWVRRAMQTLYFDGRPVPDSTLRTFATGHFGRFAGYAQLYLFHPARRG